MTFRSICRSEVGWADVSRSLGVVSCSSQGLPLMSRRSRLLARTRGLVLDSDLVESTLLASFRSKTDWNLKWAAFKTITTSKVLCSSLTNNCWETTWEPPCQLFGEQICLVHGHRGWDHYIWLVEVILSQRDVCSHFVYWKTWIRRQKFFQFLVKLGGVWP